MYKNDFDQLKITSDFLEAKDRMNAQMVTLNYLLRDLYNYTTQIGSLVPLSGDIPDKLLSLRFYPNFNYMKECYLSFKDYQSSSKDLEEELQTVYSTKYFKHFFVTSCNNALSSSVYKSVIKNLDDHIDTLEVRKTWQEIYSKFLKVDLDRQSLYDVSKFNQTELVVRNLQLKESFMLLDYCSDNLLLEHNKSSDVAQSSDIFSKVKSYFTAKPSADSIYLDSLNNFVSKVKESVLGTEFTNDINKKDNDTDAAKYAANLNSAYSANMAGTFLTCIKDSSLIAKKTIFSIDSGKTFNNLYHYQQHRKNCEIFNNNFSENHDILVSHAKDIDMTTADDFYNLRQGQISSFTFSKIGGKIINKHQCLPEIITPYPPESDPIDETEGSADSSDIHSSKNDVTIELQRNEPDSFNFKKNTLYVYLKDAEAVHEVDKNVSDSNNATNAHDKPSREYDLCMSRDNVEACPDNMPYKLYLMLKGLIDEGITNPANMPDKFGSSYSSFNNDHYLTYNNGRNIASYTLKFISAMADKNSLIDSYITLKFPETEGPDSGIFNQVYGFLYQLYDNSSSASVLTAAGVIAAASALTCKFLHPRPENEDQVNSIANKWGALAKKLLHPTTDQQIQVGDNLGHFEMRQAAEQALEMVRTADRMTQNLDAAGTPGTFATDESFELAGDSELHSPLPEH